MQLLRLIFSVALLCKASARLNNRAVNILKEKHYVHPVPDGCTLIAGEESESDDDPYCLSSDDEDDCGLCFSPPSSAEAARRVRFACMAPLICDPTSLPDPAAADPQNPDSLDYARKFVGFEVEGYYFRTGATLKDIGTQLAVPIGVILSRGYKWALTSDWKRMDNEFSFADIEAVTEPVGVDEGAIKMLLNLTKELNNLMPSSDKLKSYEDYIRNNCPISNGKYICPQSKYVEMVAGSKPFYQKVSKGIVGFAANGKNWESNVFIEFPSPFSAALGGLDLPQFESSFNLNSFRYNPQVTMSIHFERMLFVFLFHPDDPRRKAPDALHRSDVPIIDYMFNKYKWKLRMGYLMDLASPGEFRVLRDCRFYAINGNPEACTEGSFIVLKENTYALRGFIFGAALVRAHGEVAGSKAAYYLKARMPVLFRTSLNEWWKRAAEKEFSLECNSMLDIAQLVCREPGLGIFINSKEGFSFPSETRRVVDGGDAYASNEWLVDSCFLWILNVMVDATNMDDPLHRQERAFGFFQQMDDRLALRGAVSFVDKAAGVRFELRAFSSSSRSAPIGLGIEPTGITPHEFAIEAMEYILFANAMNGHGSFDVTHKFESFIKTGRWREYKGGPDLLPSLESDLSAAVSLRSCSSSARATCARVTAALKERERRAFENYEAFLTCLFDDCD